MPMSIIPIRPRQRRNLKKYRKHITRSCLNVNMVRVLMVITEQDRDRVPEEAHTADMVTVDLADSARVTEEHIPMTDRESMPLSIILITADMPKL